MFTCVLRQCVASTVLNLKSLLVMFVSYFPLNYGFKIVHIPILTCIHSLSLSLSLSLCLCLSLFLSVCLSVSTLSQISTQNQSLHQHKGKRTYANITHKFRKSWSLNEVQTITTTTKTNKQTKQQQLQQKN